MFEVGFSEIAVIAVIALIVLGPDRLPKAARMAGTFLRKARQSFESLKLEVERELEADELKKQFAQISAAPANFSNALQQPLVEAKAAFDKNVDEVMQSLKEKEPFQDLSRSSDLDRAPSREVQDTLATKTQLTHESVKTVVEPSSAP